MAIYYVGSGGNNANAGTSWALRKATLNGAEDIPVAAGDTVYVGPGTYRETLTVDVSGTAGNPITYIGDVTGQNTDGVGGVVRITGSDNDQTATRSNGVSAANRSYRTFRGFIIDTVTTIGINTSTAVDNWIIEDCYLQSCAGGGIVLTSPTNCVIRRTVGAICGASVFLLTSPTTLDNSNNFIENCVAIPVGTNGSNGFATIRVGGAVFRNSIVIGGSNGFRVATALTIGQTLTVRNCIAYGVANGMVATTAAEFAEDYNTIFGGGTARSNVTSGANSVIHTPLLEMPILSSGIRYPWQPFALSQFSTLTEKAGSSPPSLDMFGITRPATNAKNSWGPIQYQPVQRETTTTHSSSAASLRLADAGQHQMFVPTTNVSTTFSVYVQWEADYAGTKPQMIIRQPGQSDTTVTASGSSGSWEQLTTTLTPAATPGYVVVIFVSGNTAASGNFDVFFDSFTVA